MDIYLVCEFGVDYWHIVAAHSDPAAAVSHAADYVRIMNEHGTHLRSGLTEREVFGGPFNKIKSWGNSHQFGACVSKLEVYGGTVASAKNYETIAAYNDDRLSDMEFEALYDTD